MDWQNVYIGWLDYMNHLDSRVDDLAPFELVHLNARVLPLEVDWWPKSERSRYLSDLKNGSGIYWDTKKGTLYTAELLFANRGSAERQAAILIMASIDEKSKNLPDEWSGTCAHLMSEMFRVIREAFPDIILWHHASRDAMPVTVGRYFPACNFIQPKNEKELLYHFALEASLSLGNWQLIRYVPSQYLGERGNKQGS
jgi:hypothetical protein